MDSEPPSDQILMARTAEGDRLAFDALAGLYLLRLRRAALRVLGDPAAAEDVPSWCRLTGHALLSASPPEYRIRRKGV